MDEQVSEKQNTDKQRFRSPNFPYSSVRECVELIKRLDGSVGSNRVPIDIGVKNMGLTVKSSSTDRVRASLASYGLIEYDSVNGEKYLRLSELARGIVLDKREISSDRLSAYRTAALNDPMMKTIWQEWKRQLPRDDETIILILRKNYRFQEDAAKRFNTVIKDNYRFCELEDFFDPGTVEASSRNESEETHHNQENQQEAQVPPPVQKNAGKLTTFPIPLDNGDLAYVQLPTVISDEDANFIPEYINLLLKKLRKAKQEINEQEG